MPAFPFIHHLTSTTPRPSLHPIPTTTPLTLEAALLPPILYYIALLFLPPPPPSALDTPSIKLLRTLLALAAAILFFRLPLAFHVPQSIGLTYQLGLVGLYGGCRVLDAFFISLYLFGHIPKRVSYTHHLRDADTDDDLNGIEQTLDQDGRVEKLWSDGGLRDPFGFKGDGQGKLKSDDDLKAGTGPGDAGVNGQLDGGQRQTCTTAATTPISTPVSTPALHSKSDINSSSSRDSSHNTQPSLNLRSKSKATSKPGSNMPRRPSLYQTSKSHLRSFLAGPDPTPVTEHAHTEPGYPHSFLDRAAWALELELSMRGMGFTWTTADVRHTRKTWLPTVANRVHSIVVHVLPVQIAAWAVIYTVYMRYLAETMETPEYNPFVSSASTSLSTAPNKSQTALFDTLPLPVQLLLTLALGAFLMSAFSLGHSLFAILLHPLSPSPLSLFPPLYTTRIYRLTSVRAFWSYGWHRLFARLFLVYGVWPGEALERFLLHKPPSSPADAGKVLGAFASSAFVHSFSARGVVAGRWRDASGEAVFFALNGVAVVLEGLIADIVVRTRRKMGWKETAWYDKWVGRVWWVSVLAWTGRNFARGWVKSGLVREMALR